MYCSTFCSPQHSAHIFILTRSKGNKLSVHWDDPQKWLKIVHRQRRMLMLTSSSFRKTTTQSCGGFPEWDDASSIVIHPSSKIGYKLCVHLKTQLCHGKTFVVSLEIWFTLLTIPMIYLLNPSTAGYKRRRKTFVLTKYLHTHSWWVSTVFYSKSMLEFCWTSVYAFKRVDH